MPRSVFGKDIYWWLSNTGMISIKRDTFFGRKIYESVKDKGDPTVGTSVKDLVQLGVKHTPRIKAFEGNCAVTENLRRIPDIGAIIWATGV